MIFRSVFATTFCLMLSFAYATAHADETIEFSESQHALYSVPGYDGPQSLNVAVTLLMKALTAGSEIQGVDSLGTYRALNSQWFTNVARMNVGADLFKCPLDKNNYAYEAIKSLVANPKTNWKNLAELKEQVTDKSSQQKQQNEKCLVGWPIELMTNKPSPCDVEVTQLPEPNGYAVTLATENCSAISEFAKAGSIATLNAHLLDYHHVSYSDVIVK